MVKIKTASPIFFLCLATLLLCYAPAYAKHNYGIYTSAIKAYEKEFGPLTANQVEGMELYDVWGVPFIQLTDLNNDGIDELLLVRMHDESSLDYETFSAENHKKYVLHIFTLLKGRDMHHVGSFPLLQEGLSPTVQIATVDGEKFILSGDASDAMHWQRTFWQLKPEDSTLKFFPTKSFASQYTQEENFTIDGSTVNKAAFTPEYKKWMKNVNTFIISNTTAQKVEELKTHMSKEKQKLATHAPMNNFSSSALFNNGRFLLVEDMPNNAQEHLLYQYFQTITNDDFDMLNNLIVDIDDPLWSVDIAMHKKRAAQKLYIPGRIIEKMNTIPAEEMGHQTVLLTQEALPILKKLHLQEYVFVRAVVNEVADFSVSSFAPQACYGTYNFWGLVGKATPASPWKIYAIFTDHILYPHMHANPFAVKFLGYTKDWQGMPDVAPYYHDKELATIDHKDFGGHEMYMVRNTFGGETKAYEAVLTEDGKLQSGRLLHTYKPGDIMFFTCNSSDLHPNIILRYEAPYGAVYDYSPSISLKDGNIHYGPYGEEEKLKEKRNHTYRVF